MRKRSSLKWIVFIGGLGLSLLTPVALIGAGGPVPEKPPAALSDLNSERIGMKADLKIILQDRFGRLSASEHKLYKAGLQVRLEPWKADPSSPGGEDIYIYDYEKQRQYRVIVSEKIYFVSVIGRAVSIEAQREGLIPFEAHPNVKVERTKLAETIFDGRPCLLYLEVRSLMAAEESKGKKRRLAAEHFLIWEAVNLKNQPVRVVYTDPNYITKIIEYRNARIERMDPSVFLPPKGFPGLSPF